MVAAPVELAQRDAFAGADQRAGGFQEETGRLDDRDLVVVMEVGVGADFVEVSSGS